MSHMCLRSQSSGDSDRIPGALWLTSLAYLMSDSLVRASVSKHKDRNMHTGKSAHMCVYTQEDRKNSPNTGLREDFRFATDHCPPHNELVPWCCNHRPQALQSARLSQANQPLASAFLQVPHLPKMRRNSYHVSICGQRGGCHVLERPHKCQIVTAPSHVRTRTTIKKLNLPAHMINKDCRPCSVTPWESPFYNHTAWQGKSVT